MFACGTAPRSLMLVGIPLVLVVACSKEQRPTPPPPPPPAAPAPAEPVPDVPPPEEVPRVPDAGDSGSVAQPVPGATQAASPAPLPPDPCRAPACTGEVTEELAAALGGKCRLARRCYEAELANNPDLKGRVSFRVRVAEDGTLCSAKVEHDETGSAHLGACVESQFRGKAPPPGGGGCVDTVVPCNFVRGGR